MRIKTERETNAAASLETISESFNSFILVTSVSQVSSLLLLFAPRDQLRIHEVVEKTDNLPIISCLM